MARIVGGVAGGRRLQTPRGRATRPTSERAREALFSTLAAMVGDVSGIRFLDLYAGSGAVGLEAASRGAAAVLLVERDAAAAATVRSNVETLGLPGVEVRAAACQRVLAEGPSTPYDVVFLDPPYAEPVDDDLAALVAHRWVTDGSVVVVERSTRSPEPAWPDGMAPDRSRRYGDTVLHYGLWYGRRP